MNNLPIQPIEVPAFVKPYGEDLVFGVIRFIWVDETMNRAGGWILPGGQFTMDFEAANEVAKRCDNLILASK